MKWLVEEEQLPASCRFLLKLSKPDGSTTFCYTRRQVTRMIAFCYASPSLVWLGQVITALATSGLRINELAKLRCTPVFRGGLFRGSLFRNNIQRHREQQASECGKWAE